jgi:CPA2 family monovalent cation:H+ antiporter-2
VFSFENLLAVLGLAVIIVSLLRRLHLPPILGYLIAGIVVGPFGLGLLESKHQIHMIAEFGVVFLMFTIGLELSFPKLFAMRRALLGLGGLQVLICSIVTIIAARYLNISWPGAIAIAGALSLSSTAVVTKLLLEEDELHTEHGKLSLSILLFQDLAAVAFLILVPAFAENTPKTGLSTDLIKELTIGITLFIVMLGLGRWLLRPLFHYIAQAKSSELFMLTVLLVVLGAAHFTETQGLSLALGAFIAGVMLAETEYVHQIEADIQPFRDILLGLFFIAVGLTVNVDIITNEWQWVCGLLVLLILFKAVVVTGLAWLTKSTNIGSIRAGIMLAQGGEFGLFLLTQANDLKILDTRSNQIILGVVVLSMAIAPILIRKSEKIAKMLCKGQKTESDSTIEPKTNLEDHVIICGYTRVGQIQAKFLEYEGIKYVGIDLDAMLVKEAIQAGEPVHYGDATDQNILLSSGINKARLIIIAFDNASRAIKILRAARSINKEIPILVRTPDDKDMESLKLTGATEVIPDQLESSLMLATHMLILLGQDASKARQQIWEFKTNRYQMLQGYYHGQDMGHIETTSDDNNHLHAVHLSESAHATGKTIEETIGTISIEIESFTRDDFKCGFPSPFTILSAGDVLVLKGSLDNIYHAEEKLLQG